MVWFPDELSLLLPTSGSTGDPKCVRLSEQNLSSCVKAVCEYLKMNADRRSVSLLPLHYSFGLSILHNALNSRSRFVLTDLSVLDREFWTLMAQEKVTDFSGVPFIYEILRRMPIPIEVMNHLRCVTQAGGRLQPKITQYFVQLFAAAGVDYFTMYGQTEASPRIAYLAPEFALRKLGSVGVPITCGQALIAETLEPQGEGELFYKGSNVCLGYAHSFENLSCGDEFRGALKTGDQVRIDEDGFITIVGRRKRFVKVKGVSVNLDHLESMLKSKNIHCSVVGKEDKVVICYKETTEHALQSIMKANFNFHPSTVKYIELQLIPLNSSGKTDYQRLSEAYL
ncbi:MAG: AMP-binding protein [Gammaproteobacteria bacterium]